MTDTNDDDSSEPNERSTSRLPDALRKAVAAGVGAVFLTEEGIRNLVSELKLPKEAMSYLLQQADRTRSEVMTAVGKEVKRYMKSSELEKLLSDVLSHFTVEIKAEIRFKTNEQGKVKVSIDNVDAKKVETKKES